MTPTKLSGTDLTGLDAWLTRFFVREQDRWWRLSDPGALGLPPPPDSTGPFAVDPVRWQAGEPDEASALEAAIGFQPGTEIVVSSAVNGAADHRPLWDLVLMLALRYGGLIDLCGPLPIPAPAGVPVLEPDPRQRQQWLTAIRTAVAAMPGTCHEIPYATAAGHRWIYHVVDAEFLGVWLRDPRFRMVK
jgi:hypothetical protein